MKLWQLRALFTVPPFFFGTLLQTVHPWPISHGLENLFWGSVYGLGWFVVGFFVELRHPGPALFGFIVWPLMVSAALSWFAGRRWRAHDARLIRIAVAALIVTLLLDVPLPLAGRLPLAYLPLWYNQMFDIH
jgi:hypothetical protein